MAGLDANILARWLVDDDAAQSRRITTLSAIARLPPGPRLPDAMLLAGQIYFAWKMMDFYLRWN
jgi:hypothetical protein